MNSYEMMYIIRPDIGEEQVRQTVDKYREFLNRYECQDLQIKILGKKRLAYPIQKFQDGIYVQTNYEGKGDQVAPLERDMRLSEDIIRFLTVKLKPINPDAPAPAAASLPVSTPAPSAPVPVSMPIPVLATMPVPAAPAPPAPTPVPESVAEPITEPVAEPITEPVAEPITESAVEPIVESAPEPIVESESAPVAPLEA